MNNKILLFQIRNILLKEQSVLKELYQEKERIEDIQIYKWLTQSFKVFQNIQGDTSIQGWTIKTYNCLLKITESMGLSLNRHVKELVNRMKNKIFTMDTNANWVIETNDILAAYLIISHILLLFIRYIELDFHRDIEIEILAAFGR